MSTTAQRHDCNCPSAKDDLVRIFDQVSHTARHYNDEWLKRVTTSKPGEFTANRDSFTHGFRRLDDCELNGSIAATSGQSKKSLKPPSGSTTIRGFPLENPTCQRSLIR